MLCPRAGGSHTLLQQAQLLPRSTCGQAAPALAVAMTLAKVSSAQRTAGTSVPNFQHVGDCIFCPQGTVNTGEPRLSACSIGKRACGGQGDLAWLFPRRAAQSGSPELRGIPVHGSYVL